VLLLIFLKFLETNRHIRLKVHSSVRRDFICHSHSRTSAQFYTIILRMKVSLQVVNTAAEIWRVLSRFSP